MKKCNKNFEVTPRVKVGLEEKPILISGVRRLTPYEEMRSIWRLEGTILCQNVTRYLIN